MMRPEDFDTEKFTPQPTEEVPEPPARLLSIKDRNTLKALREWLREQANTDISTWEGLTKEQFMSFVVTGPKAPVPADIPPPVPVVPTSALNTSITNFQRSIKLDAKDYSKFDNPKRFMQWKRQIESTARAQGVQQVLDTDYNPEDEDEKKLFTLKKQFIYNVFETVVTVSNAKLDCAQAL